MIKVFTDNIDLDHEGVEYSIQVEVAYPKFFPEAVRNSMFKAELSELLVNVYKKYPDMVLDAIAAVCEEAADDKTDINNN